MKPDTSTAMRALLRAVRAAIPFDDPAAQECPELCKGCTPKLLGLLDTQDTVAWGCVQTRAVR